MKIAILTPFLHRAGGHGGITTWLLNVSNEFQRCGQEVHILVSAPPDRTLTHPRLDSSIEIINLGNNKLKLYTKLLVYLKNRAPHIILSAGYRYNTAVACALPLARVNCKWVMTIRENMSKTLSSLSPSKRLKRTLTLRLTLTVADRTIGVSRDLADDLVRNWGLQPHKADSIHNAVVDERIVAKGMETCHHPFFEHSGKVLLSIGRLEEQKDYSTLFKALAALQETQDVRLIVLGEGRLRDQLLYLIDKLALTGRIDLAGFKDNPYCYMRQADALVMSSVWEGFGNVLAEALAQGTPVVSTDCPSGPAEILNHGEFGPLVPVGDVMALTSGIKQVLTDPLPPAILQARAQAFSVQARVADYLALFQQLTGRLD
ncbi:MAG: glycosyltransferase [Gammaproteobacteria bacterium]|nr:glycosyltransferase [Gammaproteobacteria bacterium]